MKRSMSIGLVALSLGVLSACGGGEAGADASVKGFLDSIKSGNFEKLAEYAEGANGQNIASSLQAMPPQQREMMGSMFSKLSYKIDKTEVQGDNATVKLSLTNVDMGQVMQKVQTDAVAMASTLATASPAEVEKASMDLFKKAIADSSIKSVTTQTEVKMKKVSGKWMMAAEGNEAFGQAFLGGAGELGAPSN